MARASKPLSQKSRENADADRLKLHLRHISVGAHEYTVLSPRPGTEALWATNYYHDTWHIVCDTAGWKMLARLLWGLGQEKRTNTVLWIGLDSLQPVPFDQEQSRPILIVPTTVTHINQSDVKQLTRMLARKPKSDGTVCWRTWGLSGEQFNRDNSFARRTQTDLEGGAITVRANREALKTLAQWLACHAEHGLTERKTTHEYIDDVNNTGLGFCQRDGEVQYYRDFALISRRSASARAKIIDRNPDMGKDELREAVHRAVPPNVY